MKRKRTAVPLHQSTLEEPPPPRPKKKGKHLEKTWANSAEMGKVCVTKAQWCIPLPAPTSVTKSSASWFPSLGTYGSSYLSLNHKHSGEVEGLKALL